VGVFLILEASQPSGTTYRLPAIALALRLRNTERAMPKRSAKAYASFFMVSSSWTMKKTIMKHRRSGNLCGNFLNRMNCRLFPTAGTY
jgi:hypothetical protein